MSLRIGYVLVAGFLLIGGTESARAQQTIAEARSAPLGTTVTVEGTVTRAYGAYVRLQDASGTTGASAIVIRQASGPNGSAFRDDIADGTIQPGTILRVTGATSTFYGLIQVNDGDLESYSVQGQGSPPDPQVVTLSELAQNGEDYESELLRIDGLRLTSASGTFSNGTTYRVENGVGTRFDLRVQDTSETAVGGMPVPKSVFAFEGVLGQFHGQGASEDQPDEGYQLLPVRETDFQPTLSFRFSKPYAIRQEGDGPISIQVQALNTEGTEVSVTAQGADASTASLGSDVTGIQQSQTYTFSGSDPASKSLSLEPIADEAVEGVERLEVALSSDDGAIGTPQTFTLWVLDGPAAQGPIAVGDSGAALLDSLYRRYGNPPTLGYDVARDSLYRRVYNDNGTVESIYSGLQVSVDPDGGDASDQALGQGVNTEHLWPRSMGAGEEPVLSNLFILAPAWSEANGYRCNYPFAEIDDADAERWIRDRQVLSEAPSSERETYTESIGNACGSPSENGRIEPRHAVKGDVARAVFYFRMAYPDRADRSFFEAQRRTLLEWHEQDPVDAAEMRRMILQAANQGNRINPFVVDSTLATRAYGGSDEVLSIQEARQQGGGQIVTVEGIVTRIGSEGLYVQDETAGLYIFEPPTRFGQVAPGSRLQVRGTLQYYNGLLEMTDVPDGGVDVLSQGNPLPEPALVTLGDLENGGEAYESELVRLENVHLWTSGDDTFQAGTDYQVLDETGSLLLHVPSGSELVGTPIPRRATVRGPVGQFNGAGLGADQPDDGYRLIALDASDLTTLLPRETTMDVSRSFGAPGSADSYRLVALPGQVDRPLPSTLSGTQGVAWQAYWDDGSGYVPFDGSDTFTFRPGRGFWVLSTNEWSVEATVASVSADETGASIPLHDGWNIISNPLPSDATWADVEAANGGTLQALWRWDGGQFRETATFASAVGGEAFYFLNDQGLEELIIPLTTSSSASANSSKAGQQERAVTLVLQRGEATTTPVRVAEHRAASDGRDARDVVAPPSRFADLSLSLRAPFEAGERRDRLVRDVRALGASGRTYTLEVRADTTGPVTIRAQSLPRPGQAKVVLVHPTTGKRHNVREQRSMTLTVGPDPTRLQLLVGTASYVRTEASQHLPETVTLQPPAPNPFRDRTTLRYALPEAQHVRVEVYDLLGRRVRTLVNRRQDAGFHRATWEGSSTRRPLASGTYLIRLSAGGEQHVEQVVLVR